MIRFIHKGSFTKTERFFKRMKNKDYLNLLNMYGQKGVEILSKSTPVESGKTASSWGYEIENAETYTTIYWTNSNFNDGVNVAIILQYGHGTGTGGFVAGIDYINPAIRPIFEQFASEIWEEVTRR